MEAFKDSLREEQGAEIFWCCFIEFNSLPIYLFTTLLIFNYNVLLKNKN